jgi:hypothetical protein
MGTRELICMGATQQNNPSLFLQVKSQGPGKILAQG